MIQRAVAMDSLYGRNQKLRGELAQKGPEYYADISTNTEVYLCQPHWVYPLTKRSKRAKQPRLQGRAYEVGSLVASPHLLWQQLTVPPTDQGYLAAAFTCWPV